MLSEAVREVEQIEPTNGELEGKLEDKTGSERKRRIFSGIKFGRYIHKGN